MHEVALKDTPENRKKLYEVMIGSFFLVPVPEIPARLSSGLQTVGADVQLQITAFPDKNQRKVTPAFTDVAALRN